MTTKWYEACVPAPEILADRTHIAPWNEAIGHVVVAFGTLEQLMVHWAVVLSGNEDYWWRLHDSDMQKIAPAARKVVESVKHWLPTNEYKFAKHFINVAEGLIVERNRVAHGWLIARETPRGPNIKLLAGERLKGVRCKIAVLEVAWILERGERINQAIRECKTAMAGTCAYIPGAIAKLRASKVLD